jgi:hypothetical protein
LTFQAALEAALRLTALRPKPTSIEIFHLLLYSSIIAMDVVSSAAAVVGLVFNFATAIKTCNDIRGRYKDADRTIESVRHE